MAKNIKKKVNWSFFVPLAFVLLSGFFLRLIRLDKYPVGFFPNEALLGYRGKLLSQNLIDETGRRLPLIFTSFHGYQLPFPSYLVAFSVKLFGLSKWAVRLPFALAGCLGLVAFLGIVFALFGNKKRLLIWAAVVMGFSPWTVFLSRTTSGTFLMFNFLLIIFWLFLVLAKKKKLKAVFIGSIGIFLIFFTIAISYFRLPGAKSDFVEENFGFFTDPAIINSINQARGESLKEGNPILGKLFYNKTFYFLKLFQKVGQHFKPQFYFAAGEGNPLHGLSNFGPVFVVFLPLFLGGVWYLFKAKKFSQHQKVLLVWFGLGILPSVLGRSVFNQEKLVFAFPPLAILIAYGVSKLDKKLATLLIIFLIFNFCFVFYDAVVKEPVRAQKDWQYGTKQLVEKLKLWLGDYDRVFLSDYFSPDLGSQLLFFLDYPVDKLWSQTNLVKGRISPRQWINRIGKIAVGRPEIWEVSSGEKGLFFVGPQEKKWLDHYRVLKNNLPSGQICYQEIDEVLGLNGEPIYLVEGGISDNCILKIEKEER